MTGLLRWSSATQADRGDLSVFECTSAGRKRRSPAGGWHVVHPRIWELTVQSKLRGLRPPLEFPEYMIVGRDSAGLGAVLVYEELDGPAQVELHLAAIATRLRGKGGGVADEMVTTGLDAITSRAFEEGVDVIALSTLVDEGNHPSQALCRRFGMRHTGQESERLQQWSSTLHLTSG